MALQAGVNTSKVLILVGAGLTGSVVLNGQLAGVIAQLQELLKGVDQADILPGKYDTVLLSAQIRQLAQEIRELTLSRPVTIYNGNSSSPGSFASYLLPAAAMGAMGYCYMWWKGWSFSDVMFVTKRNMSNAVTTVSKQLENVHETLASTKRHLTKRLEGLDLKVEEHNELSQLISDDVNEVKSNLSQIGCDVELLHKMISGLEGKLALVEGKQDLTNSGVWYLCQFAEEFNNRENDKVYKDIAGPTNRTTLTLEEKALKGLQFLTTTDTVENSPIITKKVSINSSSEKEPVSKPRIHRSFISASRGFAGLECD